MEDKEITTIQQNNTFKNEFSFFKTWPLPYIPHSALLLYFSLVLPTRSSTNATSSSTTHLHDKINPTSHAKNKQHHSLT
jgi:hypothetical protein